MPRNSLRGHDRCLGGQRRSPQGFLFPRSSLAPYTRTRAQAALWSPLLPPSCGQRLTSSRIHPSPPGGPGPGARWSWPVPGMCQCHPLVTQLGTPLSLVSRGGRRAPGWPSRAGVSWEHSRRDCRDPASAWQGLWAGLWEEVSYEPALKACRTFGVGGRRVWVCEPPSTRVRVWAFTGTLQGPAGDACACVCVCVCVFVSVSICLCVCVSVCVCVHPNMPWPQVGAEPFGSLRGGSPSWARCGGLPRDLAVPSWLAQPWVLPHPARLAYLPPFL